MGAVGKFILAVVGHLGVLIVEEMVFQGCTQIWGKLIAGSDAEQGGHIVACLHTVLVWRGISAEAAAHLLLDALSDSLSLSSRDGACYH